MLEKRTSEEKLVRREQFLSRFLWNFLGAGILVYMTIFAVDVEYFHSFDPFFLLYPFTPGFEVAAALWLLIFHILVVVIERKTSKARSLGFFAGGMIFILPAILVSRILKMTNTVLFVFDANYFGFLAGEIILLVLLCIVGPMEKKTKNKLKLIRKTEKQSLASEAQKEIES